MTDQRKHFFRIFIIPVVLAPWALSFVCLPCEAQTVRGGFVLKISEKEMQLEHPNDLAWQQYLMRDLPFQRMNDRNMPVLELANSPDSTAPITEFRLTIGDTRFNFSDEILGGFAKLAGSTPGFSIGSTTLDGKGDELILQIKGGGLAPGERLRFMIDLDVDPAFRGELFSHPDYRTVLFDMNGVNVYDGFAQDVSSTDNARAMAIFNPAAGEDFAVGPFAFPDEPVYGGAGGVFNDHYRRFGDPDPVRTYEVGGELVLVPEASSLWLAAWALVGHMAISRRCWKRVPAR